MANTIAILLFDGAEEMDFVGPWEVFTAAVDRLTGERVMTVAETLRPVVCEKGMRVLPDATYEDARGSTSWSFPAEVERGVRLRIPRRCAG